MMYVLIILISLCVGFLIGMGYMLFEEYKLKPFRKAVDKATTDLINTLEKQNGYWRDETVRWSDKYYTLLLEKYEKVVK